MVEEREIIFFTINPVAAAFPSPASYHHIQNESTNVNNDANNDVVAPPVW